jgi:hypothetical protein
MSIKHCIQRVNATLTIHVCDTQPASCRAHVIPSTWKAHTVCLSVNGSTYLHMNTCISTRPAAHQANHAHTLVFLRAQLHCGRGTSTISFSFPGSILSRSVHVSCHPHDDAWLDHDTIALHFPGYPSAFMAAVISCSSSAIPFSSRTSRRGGGAILSLLRGRGAECMSHSIHCANGTATSIKHFIQRVNATVTTHVCNTQPASC